MRYMTRNRTGPGRASKPRSGVLRAAVLSVASLARGASLSKPWHRVLVRARCMPARTPRSLHVGIVALAAVLLLCPSAQAALYWPTDYGLARANLDGSEYNHQFIASDLTGSSEFEGCEGAVATSSHVYWTEPARSALARADLDGSEIEYDFITGLKNPCGVAADATSIYWTEEKGSRIARANLDGGELDRDFISGVTKPCGVAVGGGYIFWTAGSSLNRMALSGSLPQQIYEDDNSHGFCGVAVDATHVYWGGFGESIGRAGLDGSDPEPLFITGIERPCGVVVLGSRIYWTRNYPPGAIQSMSLDGNHVIETIIDPTREVPCGIAADAVTVTPPPPSSPVASHVISFGRSRHAARSPATFIRIKFPQAGSFTVHTGSAIKWRVLSSAAAALSLSGQEERLLKVWPAAGSPSAMALRARLRRTGRAQVAVSIGFSAQDGTASTKRKWLLLVNRRQRKAAVAR